MPLKGQEKFRARAPFQSIFALLTAQEGAARAFTKPPVERKRWLYVITRRGRRLSPQGSTPITAESAYRRSRPHCIIGASRETLTPGSNPHRANSRRASSTSDHLDAAFTRASTPTAQRDFLAGSRRSGQEWRITAVLRGRVRIQFLEMLWRGCLCCRSTFRAARRSSVSQSRATADRFPKIRYGSISSRRR